MIDTDHNNQFVKYVNVLWEGGGVVGVGVGVGVGAEKNTSGIIVRMLTLTVPQ